MPKSKIDNPAESHLQDLTGPLSELAAEPKVTPPKLKAVNGNGKADDEVSVDRAISDAGDFAKLFLDPSLGDGITTTNFNAVSVGKPKEFFRTVKDPSYRQRTEIYTHKPEGVVDEEHYIIGPAMRGLVDEAQPCSLVTIVYRDGTPKLWPIKLPKDGAKDMKAWASARAAAKAGFDKWVKIVWVRNAYKTREALDGYAPEPDISKLPPFLELVALAFGAKGVINDDQHPIYLNLLGAKPETPDDDDI